MSNPDTYNNNWNVREKKKLELIMPKSQRNDNSIDKPKTIVADILLQDLPTTERETKASTYHKDGAIG